MNEHKSNFVGDGNYHDMNWFSNIKLNSKLSKMSNNLYSLCNTVLYWRS